jgi:hypothetical protein
MASCISTFIISNYTLVDASRLQIIPTWSQVAGKLLSISFMLHATGGHSARTFIWIKNEETV